MQNSFAEIVERNLIFYRRGVLDVDRSPGRYRFQLSEWLASVVGLCCSEAKHFEEPHAPGESNSIHSNKTLLNLPVVFRYPGYVSIR